MTHYWRKALSFAACLHSRTFAVSMLSVICAFVVVNITSMTNAVYVTSPEGRTLDFMMTNRPDQMLESAGLSSADPSDVKIDGEASKFVELDVVSPLQVTVRVDGKMISCEAENGETVGDLLYENNIAYDGNDLLSPASEKPLKDGDEIVLKRVDYEQYYVDEEIPYETVYKNTSLLKIGQSKQIQEGESGALQKTYVKRTVDGTTEEEQLLGVKVLHKPVKEIVLKGAATPVSHLDFDLELDGNGKPLHYSQLLSDQVATGYSARSGAKTASGRNAITGHVAVNPHEIPYGSKLYIVSHDNKFIYGCAVAADTGTGLMADIVDVDLFYDTYEESVLNGRKIVDIYVLD